MKLIRILALAAAMAIVATAQNTGANNASPGAQQPAGKGPSATPTPAAKTTPGKKPVSTKASPAGAQTPLDQALSALEAESKKPSSAAGTARKQASGATSPTKGGGTAATSTKGAATAATSTKGGAPAATSTKGATGGQTPAVPGTMAKGKTGATPPPTSGASAKGTKLAAGAQPKTGTKKSAVKTAKPVAAKPPKKVPQPVAAASKAAASPPAPPPVARPRIGAAGRRDPFISAIRRQEGGPGANCSGGKRCLYIPELVLAGTVKDINGKMMAVVVSGTKRTYTLRENDQVFNGSVEKITTDSAIFREFVKDAVGRESAHEVVKKLSPTP